MTVFSIYFTLFYKKFKFSLKYITMRNFILFLLLSVFNIPFALSQKVLLDGYVFEKNNRGYLNEVKVTVLEKNGILIGEALTDQNGHFTIPAQANKEYDVQFEKKVFVTAKETVSTAGKNEGEKVYVEHKMIRQPGYLLEITLAEKRESAEIPVDAVNGSRIEIYNHTTKKEELVIENSTSPTFSITLQQGNEYSILIRKEGFFNKRLHANVNINGCYLCMEGFGTVNPGVVDNLTSAEDNKLGTLLANVEMERLNTQKKITIRNIYYALNSSELTDEAKKELDKVRVLLENNPSLVIELGSHTDSRGSDEANLKLSQARAQSAVQYITSSGLVDESRLKAKGYGEKVLVNKCNDGVPCSEAEHIQNRRTEMKIVGFTQDGFAGKSLMEIVHQEEMTRFLKSGESDKEYIDGTVNVNKPQPKPLPTPIKKQPAIEKPLSKPVKGDKTHATVEKTGSVEPFDDDKPVSKPDIQPVDIRNVTADRFDESPIPKAQPETIEAVVTKPTPTSDKNLEKITVNLKEVGDFSGYKIELFTSPKFLNAEDPDLKMIAAEVMTDVFYENLRNGKTAYSVGYFQGWTETERFLRKIISKYPAARIIEYYKGKRLGE
jgi:outer membrane protein OmpA-like peptidoglycan-associated protein